MESVTSYPVGLDGFCVDLPARVFHRREMITAPRRQARENG